jgi:16S rRNA (guanine966-N2)-methyltransferase
MRIISGSLKGKKILEPRDIKTRPLKDLTKESIFNIISHSNKFRINLEKSNVLDLFSGVGSFGIECLSRGVKNVIFIENYSGVLPILKRNLENLKSINNYKVVEKDVYNEIKILKFEEKFDLIFLDPPYKDKNLSNILLDINKKNVLNKGGIIIIHRHKKEEDIYPESFLITEKKKYGLSKIIFLTSV